MAGHGYRLAGAAALLALAACGDRDDDARNAAADTAAPGQNYQAEIQGMEEGQRNAVFIRAIRDADLERTCQGVETSSYAGETEGVPTWVARCNDGVEWLVMIGENGTAQVISREEAAAAGIQAGATANQAQ